jgi:hypothetical protein
MSDSNFQKYVQFLTKNLSVFESINYSLKNNLELDDNQKTFLKQLQNLTSSTISPKSDILELESAIIEQNSLKDIQKNELDNIRKETKNAQNETEELDNVSQRILSLQNRLEKITNERSLIEVEIKNQIIELADQRDKQREIVKQLLSYYQN